MTLKEIERLAGTGAQMPDELNAAEQLAFQSLRLLYVHYAMESITEEQGKQEKTRIIHEYNTNMLMLKSWTEARERSKKLSFLLPELKESGCEMCRKFFFTLSGYSDRNNHREDKENEQSENI